MPEVSNASTLPEGRYKENDEFVPDPLDVFGTLDTSATAGAADSKVETVTPIYEVAKAQDAVNAAKALDPNDDSVPASTVVLPGDVRTREDAVKAVEEQGKAAAAKPVEIGGLSPFQVQAAEDGTKGAETAQAQEQEQGAGSTASTTDASRQTGGSSASSSTATGAKAKA